MNRYELVREWVADTLGAYPGGLMPRDMELEATKSGIDWAWWSKTYPILAMVSLEPREAYPDGPVRPHWVLRKGADDGR